MPSFPAQQNQQAVLPTDCTLFTYKTTVPVERDSQGQVTRAVAGLGLIAKHVDNGSQIWKGYLAHRRFSFDGEAGKLTWGAGADGQQVVTQVHYGRSKVWPSSPVALVYV